MGRGRQKAKQQRIARKLKYLTTDTDYDELQKELQHQPDSSTQEADPFREMDEKFQRDCEMDEYAKWAEEAAAAAKKRESTSAEAPKRKPMRMPMPSSLKPKAPVGAKAAGKAAGKSGKATGKKSAGKASVATAKSAQQK